MAQVDYFLKFDGIKGESTDAKHKDEVDVEAWSWGETHAAGPGWQAVDRVEREAGEPHGRPRIKLCSFEELLEAAKDATPAS